VAIRGFNINISDKLSGKQATQFAQWIGASNVMRNQKRSEYVALLADGKGNQINQAYAHIRNRVELPFLKVIPVQVMRNAASLIGGATGTPKLKNSSQYQQWANVFSKEYVQLNQQIAQQRSTVIDAYGATNEAEFFAVVTETFFERPQQLRQKHPALYEILYSYYQVDPASWFN
jgi:Mlc titration factor MtfA (ptsG expression regulator)